MAKEIWLEKEDTEEVHCNTTYGPIQREVTKVNQQREVIGNKEKQDALKGNNIKNNMSKMKGINRLGGTSILTHPKLVVTEQYKDIRAWGRYSINLYQGKQGKECEIGEKFNNLLICNIYASKNDSALGKYYQNRMKQEDIFNRDMETQNSQLLVLEDIEEHLNELKLKHKAHIIICGDLNINHTEKTNIAMSLAEIKTGMGLVEPFKCFFPKLKPNTFIKTPKNKNT